MSSVAAWAERVLTSPDLRDKLAAPPRLVDEPHRPWGRVPTPGRPVGLRFDDPRPRPPSPRPRDLDRPDGRGRVLHGFANHELLALELMAAMLLRFPDAPAGWRLGLVQTMRDEQRHLDSYLQRMAACGVELGAVPVSSFFWDTLHDAPDPLAFTAAMGLGFEQANLDFALAWRGAFARAGDAVTAEVLGTVYDDEIRHVRHGVRWYRELSGEDEVGFAHWQGQLRFPMSEARARGPRVDRDGRRRAGLSTDYIDRLEVVGASRGRPPVVHQMRVGVEDEVAGRPVGKAARRIARDLQHLPLLVTKVSDVVLAEAPSLSFLQGLRHAGFTPGEVCTSVDALAADRAVGRLAPWGWSPAAARELSPLGPRVLRGPTGWNPRWAPLYRKDRAVRWQPWARVATTVDEARAACPEEGPFVIKAPCSASGTRRLRSRFDERAVGRWIDEDGAVVVQPWFDRVLDLSVHGEVREDGPRVDGVVRFATTATGVFRGVWLGPWLDDQPPEVHRFAHDGGKRPGGVEHDLRAAWQEVAGWAHELGYRGPLGVDAMVVRDGASLRLVPVVEVNPRWTMGRIGWLLRQRLSGRARGWWWFHPVFGMGSVQDWCAERRVAFPVVRDGGRLRDGFVPTTDPAVARSVLTCLHLGPAARSLHEANEASARPR